MKSIVIFGSSGFTGLKCVQAALDAGIAVRAFVRDPAKLPEDVRGKVEVIQGDVLQPDTVKTAIEGQEGVVVALGTRNDLAPTTTMSEGLKNIVAAMSETGVKKISVCLSAFLFFEPSKVPPQFLPLTEDHRRMSNIIKQCDQLDWIAVYPPHIADKPSTDGAYNAVNLTEENPPPRGRQISVHDLGHFLVHSLTKPDHYKNIVAIWA